MPSCSTWYSKRVADRLTHARSEAVALVSSVHFGFPVFNFVVRLPYPLTNEPFPRLFGRSFVAYWLLWLRLRSMWNRNIIHFQWLFISIPVPKSNKEEWKKPPGQEQAKCDERIIRFSIYIQSHLNLIYSWPISKREWFDCCEKICDCTIELFTFQICDVHRTYFQYVIHSNDKLKSNSKDDFAKKYCILAQS